MISRDLLDAACASYFVDAAAGAPPMPHQPRKPAKRLEVH